MGRRWCLAGRGWTAGRAPQIADARARARSPTRGWYAGAVLAAYLSRYHLHQPCVAGKV